MKYVPPVGAQNPDASYINGNPGGDIEGSPVPGEAFEHTMREIVHVIEASGLIPDGSDLTQLLQAIKALQPRVIHVRDERAPGVSAGVGTAGVTFRPLNTVTLNEIPGASLASGFVTLPAGVYYAEAFATFSNGSLSVPTTGQIRLNDKSRNVLLVGGISNICIQAATGNTLQINLQLAGFFTLPSEGGVVGLQQFASTAFHLGDPVTSGLNEIYADVRFFKLR